MTTGQSTPPGSGPEEPPQPDGLPQPDARLRRRLAGVPILSCDIFDTAIRRVLARPEDVALLVGAHARAQGLIDDDPAAFREYRLEAERSARRTARAAGREEARLDDIYAHLRQTGLVPDDRRAAALAALEFRVERLVCRPIAPLRALLAAREPGQRLVFVSDSILPAAALATLLADAGYGAGAEVYSSADLGVTKASGALFARLLDVLGRPGRDVVHLGDNPLSDGERARAHGIRTILLPRPIPPPEPANVAAAHWLVRLNTSLRRASPPPEAAPPRPARGSRAPPLHHYVTALLAGFALFVLTEARRRGTRRIYFLSRDGYLPMRVVERMIARTGEQLELTYLEGSRQSLVIPSHHADLRPMAEAIGFSTFGQPLRRSLTMLGFAETEAEAMLRGMSKDPEYVVEDADGIARVGALFAANSAAIAARVTERHAQALEYLRQIGFLTPGPRLLVDVGWRGSTQIALAKLTGLPPRDIAGAYIGLIPEALHAGLDPAQAAGYLFAHGYPKPRYDMAMDGYALFELFFSAPQPTVTHYERRDGRMVPAYAQEQEPEASARLAACLAIDEGCLAEIDAIDKVLEGAWPETLDADSALMDLSALLTRPNAAEVAAINAIPFINGLDGTRLGAPVRPIGPRRWLRDPHGVLRQIAESPWRGGSTRLNLPWPLPEMTHAQAQHRLGVLLRLLRWRAPE